MPPKQLDPTQLSTADIAGLYDLALLERITRVADPDLHFVGRILSGIRNRGGQHLVMTTSVEQAVQNVIDCILKEGVIEGDVVVVSKQLLMDIRKDGVING